MRVGTTLAAVLVWSPLVGCVHLEEEHFCRWHELSPPPTEPAIQQFRARFPTTPVTTTRPGSWNKIEVGMTRGMVRTLVGDRLDDRRDSHPAILQQRPPAY